MRPSSLEQAFVELVQSTERLNDELTAAKLTAMAEETTALAQAIGYKLIELCDQAELAREAAKESRAAVAGSVNMPAAKTAIARVEEAVGQVTEHLSGELLGSESLRELNRLARKGKPWQTWASTVVDGLQRAQRASYQVFHAMVPCLYELLERALSNGVSVQAHSVGQEIHLTSRDFVTEAT